MIFNDKEVDIRILMSGTFAYFVGEMTRGSIQANTYILGLGYTL